MCRERENEEQVSSGPVDEEAGHAGGSKAPQEFGGRRVSELHTGGHFCSGAVGPDGRDRGCGSGGSWGGDLGDVSWNKWRMIGRMSEDVREDVRACRGGC